MVDSQDDAKVNIGPVVGEGSTSAVHINRACFHALEDSSVSLDFWNTTWYCEGASSMLDQAYRTALLTPLENQSESFDDSHKSSFLPVPSQDSSGSTSIAPPPISGSTNSSSNAPSTVLLAAVASGFAGANLRTSGAAALFILRFYTCFVVASPPAVYITKC